MTMQSNTFVLWADHISRDHVRGNAVAFIDRLCDGDAAHKSFDIVIKPHVERRSDKQRAALFGVAEKTIAEFCGYRGARDLEELHRNLCGEYFGWKQDAMLGRVPLRTTTFNEHGERDEISVADALDMYAWIQQFAAQTVGCWVPDPDPFWREKAKVAA